MEVHNREFEQVRSIQNMDLQNGSEKLDLAVCALGCRK
jgi:hypothetical protein